MPYSNGWILNKNGFLKNLPKDVYLVDGAGEQIILIIPSLDMVVIRLGREIEEGNMDHWGTLSKTLINPLLSSIVASGPS